MIALTLAEIAAAVSGRLLGEIDPTTVVRGSVETDSRLVSDGSIFFALPGEVTDGHLFAPTAAFLGASVVIVERELELSTPQILVADGVTALADLAREVVSRVRAVGELRVVGITGSNGKTTTKNLLNAILSAERPTVAPAGSFNNHVGAPMTMLRIDESTRYLIVEMGASHRGEITRLVDMARPDIGVVLKVGLAHAGEFGGVDAVQEAKSEMVTDLPPDAVAVLHRDDPRVAQMADRTAARIVWFGQHPEADVRAENVTVTARGTEFTLIVDGVRRDVSLQILGEHHVANALAALAVARELGVPIERAVAALGGVERAERWRMERLDPGNGVIVINDAYNASPDSTAAALKTLVQILQPGERSVAVLGEMAELGEFAPEEHDRLGHLAVRLNIGKLVVVGEAARRIHSAAELEGSWDGESVHVADADAAYDLLREELRPGDVVLVKSSKSAGLRFLGDRLGAPASTGSEGGVGAA
ncbi:MAG TPA: UDP-N-acetylmuramoyl-tripeptide--D-alanyl-D-alanine ligase [Pseudolysinimonas sp.]|nr:UDP-N-acetylmuramoyl-tripeptide--D-alanyl-D-alanine ligase [Pseudolysinimonas sp.]